MTIRVRTPEPRRIRASGEEIYGRLVAVGLRVRKDVDDLLADIGISVVDLVVLRQHLRFGLPIETSSLAEMMRYSRSHISNVVRELVRRGFLERMPPTGEPRARPTRITKLGRALHAEASKHIDQPTVFADVGKRESRRLYSSLERLRPVATRTISRRRSSSTRGIRRREAMARRIDAMARRSPTASATWIHDVVTKPLQPPPLAYVFCPE